MSRYGTDLMLLFLSKAFPGFEQKPSMEITPDEVSEFLLANAPMIRDQAIRTGRVWAPWAVEAVDRRLEEIAMSGWFDGRLSVSPEEGEEMWRRWQYSIIGLELERLAGNQWDLVSPRDAAGDIRGMAILLYFLGGPGRDYRLDMLK